MAAAAGFFEEGTDVEDAVEEVGRNVFQQLDLERQGPAPEGVGVTSREIHLPQTVRLDRILEEM
jgi:hypothetical protein